MWWVVHVALMEVVRNANKFWLENLKGRVHSKNQDVNGKLILEWILEKWWEKL
jgi:hypothetical protein